MKKADFGEILQKWEQEQTRVLQVRHSSPKTDTDSRSSGNEFFDKDSHEEDFNPGEKRSRLLRIKPDDIIDIHGYTGENAWVLLEQFFEKAKNSGYEKLRIVHGKGNRSKGAAVLKETVRKFIEQCSFAGESGSENSKNGGTGATWVLLKN